MRSVEVQLGPLRLQAPGSWSFFPFGNAILARADSRIGNLQITLAFANDVPTRADHDSCLVVLKQYMEMPQSHTGETRQLPQPDALVGEATLQDGKTFRRYWYRLKSGKLVLAVYQCDVAGLPAAGEELEQAAAITATMELSDGKPHA